MYYFIKWVKIDRKCCKLTISKAWVPEMTLFLFWWTKKHTCTPEEKRLPLSGRMLRDSAVCSAESHRNWRRRHKSLLPPTIHKKSERQDRRKWTPIGQLASRWKSCLLFCQICRKNLLRTCNIVTLILSRRFPCQGQMSAQPAVGSSQHVRHVKPYFSVKYDISSSGPFWGEHWWPVSVCRILTCKWQWTVHQLPCEFVVWVTEAWYTDCVFENHGQKNVLNHYWYVVLFKNCH